MTPHRQPPRHLPDQVVRDSLQHKASLREFLQDAVPQLAAGFDCERANPLQREFPMENWRSREADLPFEVPYRTTEGESRALVCILIRAERAETLEFQAVFAEAAERLAALQSQDEVRWSDFLRVLFTYASWRRPASEVKTLVDIAMKANPTRNEEMRQMAQTAAEEWMEEGRAKGRAEGRAETELATYRDSLRRLLLRKFEQLPDEVLRRIEACADVERFKAVFERVLDWKSLEEIDL